MCKANEILIVTMAIIKRVILKSTVTMGFQPNNNTQKNTILRTTYSSNKTFYFNKIIMQNAQI